MSVVRYLPTVALVSKVDPLLTYEDDVGNLYGKAETLTLTHHQQLFVNVVIEHEGESVFWIKRAKEELVFPEVEKKIVLSRYLNPSKKAFEEFTILYYPEKIERKDRTAFCVCLTK